MVTAQVVARVLSLVGLDRTVSVYPSLDAATVARRPADVGGRAEGRPGRGSGGTTTAQQAYLRVLDALVNDLSQVGLSLRGALDLPADPARKRIEEALDELDDVIRGIRGTVFTAGDRPAPPRAPGRRGGGPGGPASASSRSA